MSFVSGREFTRAATDAKNAMGLQPLHPAPPRPSYRLEALYQGMSLLMPQPTHPFFEESSPRRSRDQSPP
jgi:hypothetical protein